MNDDEAFKKDTTARLARIETQIGDITSQQGRLHQRLVPLEKFYIRVATIAAIIGGGLAMLVSPALNWVMG